MIIENQIIQELAHSTIEVKSAESIDYFLLIYQNEEPVELEYTFFTFGSSTNLKDLINNKESVLNQSNSYKSENFRIIKLNLEIL